MPKLSTSPRVKRRTRTLIKKLLEHANPGAALDQYSSDFFEYRWIGEATLSPRLVVKTKLSFLTDLVDSESEMHVSKEHIREVLLVLKQELNLLEDNRIKTQGSDVWDFTLKLWDTSAGQNLRRFDQAWTQYKAQKGGTRSTAGITHAQRRQGLDPKLIRAAQKNKPYPLHNLTLRPDSHFVENRSILSQLITVLSDPDASAIINIVGPGGIGKTTLALEAAHRCLTAAKYLKKSRSASQMSNKRASQTANQTAVRPVSKTHPHSKTHPQKHSQTPVFDAIVFASAQPEEFLGPHLSERWQTDRTLKDVIREIVKTLDRAEGSPFNIDDQISHVQDVLKGCKTLLILDNLETAEDPHRLLSFVRTLPPTVKVILTSRTRFGVGKIFELNYLGEKPGFSLIAYQAKQKMVSLKPSQIKEIYRLSGGLPLAMAYSVGYLSVYQQMPVLRRSHPNQPLSEIAQYCVEASLNQLKDKAAYCLLMAATLFADRFSAKAAAYVAGLAAPIEDTLLKDTLPFSGETGKALANLHRLSLVNQLDSAYFSMHAFTQDCARARLDQALTFKHAAQQRWIGWYVKLVTPFSEQWFDWQDYRELDREWENIRALANWCLKADEYQAFHSLWQGLRGYTLLRGYWDERQAWMDRLISMAKERDDKTVLSQAMFYKGQTLVHIDETDAKADALDLLKAAWELGYQLDADVNFGSVNYIAAIYLKGGQFEMANYWLTRKELLETDCTVSKERQAYMYSYYTAEIALRQENYAAAEQSYRQALAIAQSQCWRRSAAYSQGWLAITLIKKGDLEAAADFVSASVEAAEKYEDKRSMAKGYSTLAMLAKEQHQEESFIDWATLAMGEFETLGMRADANLMQQWLETGVV